jgi:hypothetical protein
MWGPHGAKWRHVTRATSAGPRFVGLVGRKRRPAPETTGQRLISAFFLAIVLLIFAPMIVIACGQLFTFAFVEYAPFVVAACLALWVYAVWRRDVPWRAQIALSFVATAFAAAILYLVYGF